jgi:hypothetical protein
MEGKSSPWGKIQHCEAIIEGIVFVSTAGHGGLKLDRKRNAAIPAYLRRPGGWYEEDCEYAIPLCVFASEFSEAKVEAAKQTFASYFPHSYAQFYNVPVESLRGKSYQYDHECFDREHASDLVGIAAWGDWQTNVPKGMVGVLATRGGQRTPGIEKLAFLVSSERYKARGQFGYVIQGDDAAIDQALLTV